MAKISGPLQKILIIRMSSIGDIILTSPLIRQLRQKYPEARIDYLIRKEYTDLVRYNPHLSNNIELDVRQGRAELKALREKIRHEKYDLILDLHRNLRSTYLRSFTGHSPLLKIRKNQILRFLLVKFKINLYAKFYGHPLSVAEKYLRAAAPLGLTTDDMRLEVHLPEEVAEKGKTIWRELTAQNFQIIMAPGAKHFTKRWPPEYYTELIHRIYKKFGWRTLLVGGPDEVDVIKEIQLQAGNETQRSLAGKISLLETFAIIQQAPFFISNDSGLMHAAAAFQKPQIAIFGSTVKELGFSPVNPNAILVENHALKCRPCSHIGRTACPLTHFKCMRKVTPERVWEEFQRIIA
jgi:heptosyltransferase-2